MRTKLGCITKSIFDGKHGDCESQKGSGLYFISVKDLTEYDIDYRDAREITEVDFESNYMRTFLENGDTVYANTGDTIGKCIFVKDNPMVKQTSFQKSVAVIKPDTAVVEPRYLFYLLKYITPLLRKASTGSAQKNLLLSTLREFDVDIHERHAQIDISTVLGSIDDKIRCNLAICAELDSMVKTIYDYWFTQFDFPDADGKPYCSSGGAMEWSEHLKRKIPQGWKVAPLSTIISGINTGLNPRDSFALGNGDIQYLTVKNLTTAGTIDFNGCDAIDEEARAIIHRRSDISIGDILFASIAPLGRCYLIQSTPENWDINESIFSIRGNSEYVTPEFLYMYFMSDTFIKGATSSSTGSIFKGVRINTLLDMVAVIPPKRIAEAFSAQIKDMLALKAQKIEENMELTRLRDWLLPMLMNGQATVADAEEEVSKIIPFVPQAVEVRQAARNFGDKKTDDTADLVKAFMRRKKNDSKA